MPRFGVIRIETLLQSPFCVCVCVFSDSLVLSISVRPSWLCKVAVNLQLFNTELLCLLWMQLLAVRLFYPFRLLCKHLLTFFPLCPLHSEQRSFIRRFIYRLWADGTVLGTAAGSWCKRRLKAGDEKEYIESWRHWWSNNLAAYQWGPWVKDIFHTHHSIVCYHNLA